MTDQSSSSRAAQQRQWLDRVDSALRAGGFNAAVQVALQAHAAGVEDAAVLNLAASAYYRDGRLDEAAQLLRRAQALAPGDPNVLNSLGVCLRALGKTEEALQAYDAALRIDPEMAAAHCICATEATSVPSGLKIMPRVSPRPSCALGESCA